MLLKQKNTSSLVVMMGRRRIGKSYLLKKYAESFSKVFLFDGLAPHEKQTNEMQLAHFAKQLSEQTGVPGFKFGDWTDALKALAKQVSKGVTFVLLDEISWMGKHDPDFPGKLKSVWDSDFLKNPNLVFAVCGSVSSWIEKNILKSSDFLGRISFQMTLQELPLNVIHYFTGKHKVPKSELIRYACITGCVPKYLTEIRYGASFDEEIQRLCFTAEGFLFNEYEKIFRDIFERKTVSYKKVVNKLAEKKMSANEVAKELGQTLNSDISESLKILRSSGFLARDYNYNADGTKSKLSVYRLKDNYLRFYIKKIEPIKNKIEMGDDFANWLTIREQMPSIIGMQFQNLVLNHLSEIIKGLEIPFSIIKSASPYFQKKTTKNKGACQIDLLIQCNNDVWYVCEIKFKKIIDSKVKTEVERKLSIISKPKSVKLRSALIYFGQATPEILASFDKALDVGSLV